jgi:hypothetical protein
LPARRACETIAGMLRITDHLWMRVLILALVCGAVGFLGSLVVGVGVGASLWRGVIGGVTFFLLGRLVPPFTDRLRRSR